MKILSFLLVFLPGILFANIQIKNTPVPGGIAVIDFQTNHSNPKGFYNDIPLYVQHIKNQHWQAFVGIPLLTKAGIKKITIKDFSTREFTFEVKKKKYEEQYITLEGKKKKYVNPNLKHMDRINEERPLLTKTRKIFSDKALTDGFFSRPVNGITTSEFGLRRFYNNKPRRPHTGLDFAADTGAPIKAPANGNIILTGNFFFNGNAVFIDHGKGLISVYIHMDKILVKQGQYIEQGEKIGTVGQTGRATGPHLHWGVYLNQVVVNPKIFTNEI